MDHSQTENIINICLNKKKADKIKRNQTLTILKILNAFCIGLAEIPRIKKGNNTARYLYPAMIVCSFGILLEFFTRILLISVPMTKF